MTAPCPECAALRERAERAIDRGAKTLTVERLAEAMRSHDNERGGPYDESEAAGLFRHLVGPVVVPDRAEELARAIRDHARGIGLHPAKEPDDYLTSLTMAIRVCLASLPVQPAPADLSHRLARTRCDGESHGFDAGWRARGMARNPGPGNPGAHADAKAEYMGGLDLTAPTHDAAWQAEARRLVDGVEQAAALHRRHPQMGDADTGGLTAARSALLRHLGIPEQAEGGGEG